MTLQMEQKLSKSSEEKYPKINVLASKLSVQKEMVESIQVTTDIILLENELLRIRKTRTRVYYSLCDFREELIKNTSFQRVSFQVIFHNFYINYSNPNSILNMIRRTRNS